MAMPLIPFQTSYTLHVTTDAQEESCKEMVGSLQFQGATASSLVPAQATGMPLQIAWASYTWPAYTDHRWQRRRMDAAHFVLPNEP